MVSRIQGTHKCCVTLVVLIATVGGVRAAGPAGAYRHLDDRKLARQLSEMGMFELLEGLVERMADPSEARFMLARGKLARVSAGGLDPQQREKILDEAIVELERLADSRAIPTDSTGLLRHFRLVLDLIEAQGILKARPYALRMMYLQAGPKDRTALVEITEPVIPRIEKLKRQISDATVDWGADLKKLVTVLPELETLRENLRYKSAWVRFYRGMALAEAGARRQLLEDAISAATHFAQGDERSGVKYWSDLLIGMCRRELGARFELADQALRTADAKGASPAVRTQAKFEIARNLADWGRYEQALEAARGFRTFARQVIGKGRGAFELDVQATMLENYVYDGWADGEAAGRDAHRLAAQKVLVQFLNRYADTPAIRDAFLETLAGKHAGLETQQNASSVILLAVASTQLGRGSAQSLDQAERLLKTILQRDDAVSEAVHPDAMWQLAVLMNSRRANVEAGRLFTRLAQKFPQHRLALIAAKNAVNSFSGIIDARRQAEGTVAANLRRDFIGALETLLGKWADQEELSKWYFDLGWQYQQLAGEDDYESMQHAVDAYARLPAASSDWMQARYLSLELQAMILDGPKEQRTDPTSLVARLDRYGTDAAMAAATCKDEELTRSLMEWGALAEFQAAKCLYERLDRKPESLVRLSRLPERWPTTDALQITWEFEIGKLVEQERTDEAIGKVELFNQKYPTEAAGLIHLVARQLRGRIEEMRADDSQTERLNMYGEVFRRFAEQLHADAKTKGLSPQETYPINQMRAEAMLAVSRPEQAIVLFQECADQDAAKRAESARKIDEETNSKIEAVRSVADDVIAVRRLVDDYFAAVARSSLSSGEVGPGDRLARAVQFLKNASTQSEQADRLATTVDMLIESLEALRGLQKLALPVDAQNILGLARANAAKGDYSRAIGYYSQLVSNTDRSEKHGIYWHAQLERCECMFQAFRADKQQMRRLTVLLRQLELADRSMGGLRDKFLLVQSRAEQALQ